MGYEGYGANYSDGDSDDTGYDRYGYITTLPENQDQRHQHQKEIQTGEEVSL